MKWQSISLYLYREKSHLSSTTNQSGIFYHFATCFYDQPIVLKILYAVYVACEQLYIMCCITHISRGVISK